MMPVETFFGVAGGAVFLAMAFYARGVVENIERHRDVSLAKFFIDERGFRAFRLLAVSGVLYSIAMVVTAVEYVTGGFYMLLGSRLLILLVSVIAAEVLRQLYIVTATGE